MRILKTLEELRSWRRTLRDPLGFIPTMGYLHKGHLSLVRHAQQECASTLVSIFVNPTQFSPNEDFSRYPSDIKRDLKLLAPLGVNGVWIPEVQEIYPAGFQTTVHVTRLTQPLEGRVRPGHFDGVATVITKLFHAATPQRAYFGQKDAQQVLAMRQMSRDLNFPVDIIACPTVREPDGLAFSSRNSYLARDQRAVALGDEMQVLVPGHQGAEGLGRQQGLE